MDISLSQQVVGMIGVLAASRGIHLIIFSTDFFVWIGAAASLYVSIDMVPIGLPWG